MPSNLENATMTTGLEKISFRFNPKDGTGNVKQCSNYFTIALISHTSKVMLKILPARFQQYMNRELPEVQAGFRKGRGIRDQIVNIHWIIEKIREFQKNIYFCFIDYTKAFVWITTNCGTFFKRWEYLTCLLRNLYSSEEATVRTVHGTTDWFQIGKGVRQGCILSHCLFNLHAEYIMQNDGLDEAQAGIKTKVKEESEKVGLKLNIQKMKIMASGPITSWLMGKQWKQ